MLRRFRPLHVCALLCTEQNSVSVRRVWRTRRCWIFNVSYVRLLAANVNYPPWHCIPNVGRSHSTYRLAFLSSRWRHIMAAFIDVNTNTHAKHLYDIQCSVEMCVLCTTKSLRHTHTIADRSDKHTHRQTRRHWREGEKQTCAAVSMLVVACDVRTRTQLRKTTNRQLEGQQISLGFYPREITTLFQSSIVTVVNETATFFYSLPAISIFTWFVRSPRLRAQSQSACDSSPSFWNNTTETITHIVT